MDINQRLVDLAKEWGRQALYPYVIGNIKAILGDLYYTAEQKVQEIGETLAALSSAQDDDSLPWDRTDAEKPSAPTESIEKITQLHSSIETTKVESLVDPAWAEEILRNERCK